MYSTSYKILLRDIGHHELLSAPRQLYVKL